MKTLVSSNQKGGVGKTANLVHFAWYAAEAGKKVVVIDFDPQGNASKTLAEFSSKIPASSYLLEETPIATPLFFNNITLIPSDEKLADVERKVTYPKAIRNLKNHLNFLKTLDFDLCLIDTPPTLGVLMVAAIGSTDFIVTPIEMESYSLDGVAKLWNTIEGITDEFNPNVEFLGMFPSRFDGRTPRHKKTLKKLLETNPDMMLNYPISLRTSVGDALAVKKPVWKLKKTSARKAADEIKALAEFIFKKMGIL